MQTIIISITMNKLILSAAATLIAATVSAEAPLQSASYGTVDRHYIYSPELAQTMTVDILTPEGYNPNDTVRYPVLYMHDGQNLFDANTTWNHQAWEVDSVMGALAAKGIIRPAIVVGVHSVAQTRTGDLMPQKPIESLPTEVKDSLINAFRGMNIRSDAYTSFLAKTLKQYVDSAYLTLSDPANTSVMGSSMGGIISMYVICEYPEVFGNAACLSTHWVGHEEGEGVCSAAMLEYLDKNAPDPANHKFYFDQGTMHSDAWNISTDAKAADILINHGYTFPSNLLYVVDRQAGHMEIYWARRLSLPLILMLGK